MNLVILSAIGLIVLEISNPGAMVAVAFSVDKAYIKTTPSLSELRFASVIRLT